MSRIFLSAPHISGRERELVAEVFDSNYVAPTGQMLTRFESEVSSYCGIEHAVALSSGTAAIHLALLILGVGKGDEVWTSSMTFIGGASPIKYVQATPVFFDLCEQTWGIDTALLEESLAIASKQNRLPKAIIPTDLYGQAADLDAILALAKKYGVAVVSDSAESLGAFACGVHAGKGADATVFSFNGNKIITTSGGGMLLSDNKSFIEKARYLSTQARQPVTHYEHTEIGYNYRLSNICAAIGVGQLECLEDKITSRRRIFDRYTRELADIESLSFMPEPDGYRSTRWLSCATLNNDNAQSLLSKLYVVCENEQIEIRPLWKPMHMQPVFSGSRFVGSGVCERLFDIGVCLPSASSMTENEQDRVIDVIRNVVAG